jgi:NitT/TauT family transport system substrate-binding protein
MGAGYFEDEGLTIQTVFPPVPDRAGMFMLMGFADVALLPPPMYLPLIEAQEDIRVFANLFEHDQINLIIREEFAAANNLSEDMPLAEKLEAIRGLKVGVAPGPPVRLRVLFETVGMDADTDIDMVITQPHDQNDAFGDGSIDALYAHTPYLETALNEQGAVILVNQSAGEVPGLNGRQRHSLVATRSFISDNRDRLVALTRAIHRAQQLIHSDEAATVEALLNSGVPGLERSLVETIVSIYAPAIPDSPLVSLEGLERAVELFPAHRPPPDLTGIDFADYAALGIAEDAIAP